ncbi:FkbO/Hyg5 family chorismatase [Nocardia abscessus]|uniref:FkbO/Hyg5 family chorismatase n=1 Tax=Nocardia abscessus TaxID=120957 RepID=UPI002456B6F4|nr:FkbO/Hyg5 family chorismatase [Nocardia abscessus]
MIDAKLGIGCVYRSYMDDLKGGENALAIVAFGDDDRGIRIENGIPYVPIRSRADGFDDFLETWRTAERREVGQVGALTYAYDDEHLFCAGYIPHSRRYTEQTFAAYAESFKLADELGFPELFRMWNYVGRINDVNGEGLEVYRDFCRGRAEAFESFGKKIPAATGVGSRGDGITFYFLSCRTGTPEHIENPRQVPAYKYPRNYGPKSPMFARATLLESKASDSTRDSLFISGTASILGHESVHADDIHLQCDVTLENISQLISDSNLQGSGRSYGYELGDLGAIKVYVRRREDLELIRNKCMSVFSSDADIRFLNMDICRKELLVEIEGII